MQASVAPQLPPSRPKAAFLGAVPGYFLQPAKIVRSYQREFVRPDLIAGITVAVVLLPQAIAYALVAELPPQMGLYTAFIAAIVGAFWGSSNQLHTGPTNAASLLLLSVLLGVAAAGSPEYVAAAGLMAVMVGLLRLLMGVAGLGVLVNFISDSVIVGFTAGAGVLIAVGQIRNLLGLPIASSPGLLTQGADIVAAIALFDPATALLGLGTLALLIVLRRRAPRLPGPLLAMVLSAAAVAVLGLNQRGVAVIGEMPRSLPPLADLPLLDIELIGQLSTGALAIAVIGLIEAMSIARSIGSQTGQRVNSNQEFVGQGMANIACGFFSGFTCSGSFTRSAVNFEAGARSPIAAAASGVFVLIAMLLLAPFTAYVPRTALAAVLLVTAYGMVDRREIARIWQSTQGDKLIMVATIGATLLLPLQFAVLTGVMMSLAYYVWRTSAPRVYPVVPDAHFKHLVPQQVQQRPPCPQLGILEIRGDLYFGAAPHVEEMIVRSHAQQPQQRFLLLRMVSVDQIDISGVHMLEGTVRSYREQGGDVFLVRVQEPIFAFLQSTGFADLLGRDHFLDDDTAISQLFHRVLDPAVCIYECEVKVFKECQNLPKQTLPAGLTLHTEQPTRPIPTVTARALWEQLHSVDPPLILDVREPREYQRAHIPQAQLLSLPKILAQQLALPHDRHIVLTCRSGRRSMRAAHALAQQGYDAVAVLDGGLVAWEAAGLLEAVDLKEQP
jgi:sulfate permease, SulP family